MIFFKWKIIRLLIIGGIIVGITWLSYWVVPTLGFFHLALSDPLSTENGISLVLFNKGKCTAAYSLSSITLGWSIVKEFWPLILFGVMIGYPLGELGRRLLITEQISDRDLEKKNALSLDMFIRESKAKNMMQEAMERTAELPQLREELKLLRKKILRMNILEGEQKRSYEVERRKAESLEKELFKARAKIRRQATKKRIPEKSVDA